MIKSMTGYGKGRAATENLALTVEIKSVNHRYCDISVKSPRSFLGFEPEIKKRIAGSLGRGKIDVFVNPDSMSGATMVPTLNRPLAKAYVELFEEMGADFAVEAEIPLSLLAAQKDVVVLKEGEMDEAEVRRCLEQALAGALEEIERMRVAEGEAMHRDISERLDTVEERLRQAEARAPKVPVEWREKLRERLERLEDVAFDPQRVAQEVAIFADRCDISEEMVRFRSHLGQMRQLLAAGEPVGRQMDFLVQEMNREVNTMGSKANDAELARLAVAVKAELEKVREQVQNIE